MSSYEQHKPDWAFWRVLPAVAPWEAVALSMDVEPRKLLAHPYGGGASGVAVSLIPPLGFSERLELANRCIGSEMLPGVEPLSGTEPTVSLQTFATWAAGVGWPLPEELLRVVAEEQAPPYRTGLPGKPTSWHLVEAECRRRHNDGERHPQPPSGRECCSNG
jgi:hypothetical protein